MLSINIVIALDVHKCRAGGRLGKVHQYNQFIDGKKILGRLNELLEVAQHNVSEPIL